MLINFADDVLIFIEELSVIASSHVWQSQRGTEKNFDCKRDRKWWNDCVYLREYFERIWKDIIYGEVITSNVVILIINSTVVRQQ